MFSGRQPRRGKSQSPVAWITGREETNNLKLIDQATFGVVSESPGRNASELTGGPVTFKIRRPSPLNLGEGSIGRRRLADTAADSGGVLEAAR